MLRLTFVEAQAYFGDKASRLQDYFASKVGDGLITVFMRNCNDHKMPGLHMVIRWATAEIVDFHFWYEGEPISEQGVNILFAQLEDIVINAVLNFDESTEVKDYIDSALTALDSGKPVPKPKRYRRWEIPGADAIEQN